MIARVNFFLACVYHCVGIAGAVVRVRAEWWKDLEVGNGLPACQKYVATERAAVDDEVWDDVLQYFGGFVFISGVGCFLFVELLLFCRSPLA